MLTAIRYVAEVGENGQFEMPRVDLEPGTPVEVILLVQGSPSEVPDLGAAAGSSLGFWDNPIDDEVWNDARPA